MLEERGIFPISGTNADFEAVRSECVDATLHDAGDSDVQDEPVDGVDDGDDDDAPVSVPIGENVEYTSRRAGDVSAKEIQAAIQSALAKCPNRSCKVDDLTSLVLKEVGVLTRGRPREKFENRVFYNLAIIEKQGAVERYRAKNERVRLIKIDARLR